MSRLSFWPVAALMAIAGLLLAAACPPAAAAEPALKHAIPGGVAPGKTTELTLSGSELDGPLRVWTSFPAAVEIAAARSSEKAAAVCKVTLGGGVPVGIGGIAVANSEGASDVIYLMIDDLPSVSDRGDNHSPAQAQPISLPVAIDGQGDGTLSDFYQFTAKSGQRIACEVVAARLGWDFDPLVRVLDAGGGELLLADDDPATGADTRFVFTAPADGAYLLELRDNRYKPGGRYRLRLGDFPLVTTPSPLAVQRGVQTPVVFRGPLALPAQPLAIMPLGGLDSDESLGLSGKQPGQEASGWATLKVANLPVHVESASAGPDEASPAAIPCIFAGALEAAGERDTFRFAGGKGERVHFRAITRSAGSPAIVRLRLLDAAGKQLAESPVTDSDEPVLSAALPASGVYQLAVEELAGRGGGDYTYAVECRTGPQFSLALKNDKNNRLHYSLPPGGAIALDVQCQRTAYDGPIRLRIDSPRQGWQIINSVIPAKANEVKMYVVPPLDLAAGELAELRIVGSAEGGPSESVAAMSTLVQLRAARPQTPYPPAWHEGTIFVSGLAPAPGFFTLTGASEVTLSRAAGEAKLTLDLTRTDPKFKDTPLTVLPLGLPPGVTAEVKRNASGGKETYDMVLKGARELADGLHTLRYFAYAELAGQGRGVVSGEIRVNVMP